MVLTDKKYIIQSIIFNNVKKDYIINFCKEHNFKHNKMDFKDNNIIRVRQYNPDYIEKNGFNIYRIHKINNNISFVIAYKS